MWCKFGLPHAIIFRALCGANLDFRGIETLVLHRVVCAPTEAVSEYRGTSLIRNRTHLGPYSHAQGRTTFLGGWRFLMSEVPLYDLDWLGTAYQSQQEGGRTVSLRILKYTW